VARVIGAHLHFKAVDRPQLRARHDARIVEEDVQAGLLRGQGVRKSRDGREVGQVEGADGDGAL
jgi:hypothetical protein